MTQPPPSADGSTIEERVINTLKAAALPIPFCYLVRHCCGYEFDLQMHAIVCERIIQLKNEGKLRIADDSPEQDNIYALVSPPNTTS